MGTDDAHDPTGKPAGTDRSKAYARLGTLLNDRMQAAIDKANAMPFDEPPLLPMWSLEEIKAMFDATSRRKREAARASFDLYFERFLKHRNE